MKTLTLKSSLLLLLVGLSQFGFAWPWSAKEYSKVIIKEFPMNEDRMVGINNKYGKVSVETWDMHGNADVGIFENGWNGLPFALPIADQAVATLLEDLEDRGLLESTLVVFVGEFGRTPKIFKGAKRIGRDHWPQCYSGWSPAAESNPTLFMENPIRKALTSKTIP